MATRVAGAGGKYRKSPLKKPQTKPYDRPTPLRKNPSWLSKMILYPASNLITSTAHRFFSSVTNRIVSPPPIHPSGANQESRATFQETVLLSPVRDQAQQVNNNGKQGFPESQGIYIKDSGRIIADTTGLSELELMLKQKTFTRSEIDRLTTLLRSRTVESFNVNGEKNNEFHPQETVSALRGPDNFASSLCETMNESPLNNQLGKYSKHHGLVSTAVVSSKVFEEDIASPTELAKAYMDNRFTKASPSVSTLRSQATREEPVALGKFPFTPGSSATSLVQKPSVQGEVFENGFATPRSRGRSAIYSMARTPYSRVHPTASLKGNSSIFNGSGGSSASPSTGFARELVARSVSKDLALKRRNSVLDDEFGSAGPIRRLRQKTNLSSPNNTSLTMGRTPYSNRGNGIVANGAVDPSSSKTLERSEDNEIMPGSSNTPVPSQSKETAKRILQQLQILSPIEKREVGASSENPPTKLTPNMLHGQALRSLENMDSSKVFQDADYSLRYTEKDYLPHLCETSSQRENKVEENGSKGVNIFHGSLALAGTSNSMVLSKDTVPVFSFSEPVKKQTVTQSSPKKWGFQMSAHEDFLDMDDEIPSSEADDSAKFTKGKNILETPVINNKAVPVTQDNTTIVSELKAPTVSSVSAKPTDKKTFDENKVVEESSGFMFSSAPVPSTLSPPVITFSQSTMIAENGPDKEPDAPPLSSSGAKIDDKISPSTVLSSPFVGGSVGVKSAPPVEVQQENTKSLAFNVSGTTETVPKPGISGNGIINNTQNSENTLERPEIISSSPQSANSLFTFGSNPSLPSLSNGSLNSTTTPSLHSSSLPIIPPTNPEDQTLSNSFTAIPFPTKNSSNAFSEPTPSTSATATPSSFLAPAFKFESTSTTTTATLAPSPITNPEFKESSSKAPSTYSTLSATSSAATDVKITTEKQDLLSNPFSAMSSPLIGTGSSVFGFNAGSSSSSGSASLSQGSVFGTQSIPVFGSSGTTSTMATSVSTLFATSSTSTGPVFGNMKTNSFVFGSSSTTSSSLFSSSTPTNSPFGTSTTSKDSSTTTSPSTMFSFGAQTPVFGSSTSTSSSVFSFGGSPQTQPMFGSNTVVPAFGSVPGGNNGNQMTMSEDTMAEDLAGPTPPVPVFGQPPVPNPSPNPFMFGSTPPTISSGVVPFQFGGQPSQLGGQPSQLGGQTANPFQQSGNGLNFGGGDGSFSLGSGGGADKSSRRMIKIKNKSRRK